MKRNRRNGAAKPARKQEPGPGWPPERHSGEGSASAWDTLQQQESRRRLEPRPEPRPGEDS